LTELLLDKGYVVHGLVRRSSTYTLDRIDPILGTHPRRADLHLYHGDLTDSVSLFRLVGAIKPHEIYNLAAQSHVAVSFESPEYTANSDALGTLRLLEAIRLAGLEEHTRFYQASTSELYGLVQETPQRETTPFYPRSPYGVAKLYAYWITVNYRESYGMFACNGILFNHESPLRGETFVTRKITRAVAAIHHGKLDCLRLGNLDSQRDWGHARDYVEGMWRMLQHQTPEDFVLATGQMHTVRSFVEQAFSHIGVTLKWAGQGEHEQGICTKTGRVLVAVDPKFYRPAEVDLLLGDPTKAQQKLGWVAKTDLAGLVADMMQADLAVVAADPRRNWAA
jgi:GDPmannose 4,6-dehydratase